LPQHSAVQRRLDPNSPWQGQVRHSPWARRPDLIVNTARRLFEFN
jgi:hypothetical protein